MLTNALLRSYFAHRGWRAPSAGETFLFGIRGATPSGPASIEPCANTPDRYNDTLGVAGADWLLVRGTVDPGLIYTQAPTNPGGCAHLADGEHLFSLGPHHGHAALKQFGAFRIWRDRNRDSVQSTGEPTHAESGNGIDIHAGGTSEQVGPWSAGCQVVHGGWDGEPWQLFYAKAAGAIRARQTVRPGQIAYFLCDAEDLVRFANTPHP